MAVAVETLLTTDISRPARYLGNELGSVHKAWESATVRWSLTYPEVYEVGASNLGHIILYSIINAQPRQLCDRAYLPAADLTAKLRETQTPLFAVESRRPLTDFDILGFSLSYELGATNILEMLDLAGIPLTWQERNQTNQPLIFAGGQTATSNPEPYADFFDFIALGDGEELLPEIGMVLEEGKLAGLSREALLMDLAQVPGVYVPQFYDLRPDGSVEPNREGVPDRVLRRVADPIPAYSIGLVPFVETVHDRLTVEIRRGCTRGCRFCQPGMLTRPARDVEPEKVVEAIEQGMRATGYNEFSLLSLSCSDYLALPAVGMEIKNRLKDENVSLSLPSQRVDRFDENIANILGGTRPIGLTFAPEAGTQRLRDIINKGLTNEELLRGVKTARDQGWDKVKLYFMIGLPGETDLDVLGIVETLQWLRLECVAPKRRAFSFNITISNFTPKPHTPFQWHSVSSHEFKRKQGLLRDGFRDMRNVKVNFTDVRISAMEDFVGRGDRRLGAVVKRAWELGAGMDSWWESLDRAYGAWTQAIAEAGMDWKYRLVEKGEWNLFGPGAEESAGTEAADLNPSTLETGPKLRVARSAPLSTVEPVEPVEPVELAVIGDPNPTVAALRLPDVNAPLPWDHLDTGIDKQWLHDDLARALEAAIVPDCSFDGCSHCGVCGVDFGHNVVVPPQPIPDFVGHFTPNKTRAQRIRVRFGKLGDMALVGHLDLLRLFDRVIRRAAIPISFTGGFHPSPRIAPANALPLGHTSSGELVDFELTREMDVIDFQEMLTAQMPIGMPVYHVEALPLNTPAAAQLMETADYILTLALAPDQDGHIPEAHWQFWVGEVLSSPEILIEHKTKSGQLKLLNLRERLYHLELLVDEGPSSVAAPITKIHFRGSCRNDGTVLRPDHVVKMLEWVSGLTLELRHVHRTEIRLVEVELPTSWLTR